MIILIIFAALSIGASFLCSILEAVLLSVTPAYVKGQVSQGTRTGILLDQYKKDIDRPLSAILTLNTIAHTVGAIGVGIQAGELFGSHYIFEETAFAISYESIIAVVMTLAILILSEIIPKTIGANNWRKLAPFTIVTIKFLLFILTPFVWLSQLITKGLKKDKIKSVLSRADFTAMLAVGEESGSINTGEFKIIKNLLNFEKKSVREIMTPKTVALLADENLGIKEFYDKHQPLNYSRIPIYSERDENITGMVLKDEILKAIVENKGEDSLKSIKRELKSVEDTTLLHSLFKLFTKDRSHIYTVVDNFGSLVGLVSLEDLFETLLGLEIVDEFDKVADLQELALKKYLDKQS